MRIDVDLVLKAQRRGDVVVCDGTEHLVLCAYLETHDDSFIVDELGQFLGLVAVFCLASDDGLAEPPRLRLRALPCHDRQPARDQVVAPVAVRHLSHIPCLTDVLDVFDQHYSQADSSSDSRNSVIASPAPRREVRRRTPSCASASAIRRSRSKTLSPLSMRARCSSTTSSGQASTNTLMVRAPRASASRSPTTGTQAGTLSGLTMRPSVAPNASLGPSATRSSRTRQ